MVISEYIASGILEQYVMGTATPQERQEVECMSKIYPELKDELTKIEAALEAYAQTMAVAPPPALKARIMEAIDGQPETAPQPLSAPEAKVVTMQPSRRMTYLAAASIVGLLAVGVLWWSSASRQQREIAALEQRVQDAEGKLSASREEIAILINPDNTLVKLAGLPAKSPTSNMQVVWNKQTKELYISSINLPKPAEGKQYQLWALDGGKPVDMGVFDVDDSTAQLIKMKNAEAAQAFAVTLEPKGGSASPTLTEMYVMGNI